MLALEQDGCVNVALCIWLLCGGVWYAPVSAAVPREEPLKSLLRLIDGGITGSLTEEKEFKSASGGS